MKLPKRWTKLTPAKLRQTRAVQYLARWIWRELKEWKIPPLRVCAYQISAKKFLNEKLKIWRAIHTPSKPVTPVTLKLWGTVVGEL